jgi:hypothetical protein
MHLMYRQVLFGMKCIVSQTDASGNSRLCINLKNFALSDELILVERKPVEFLHQFDGTVKKGLGAF